MFSRAGLVVFGSVLVALLCGAARQAPKDRSARELAGWRTNTAVRSIQLSELVSGGPGKDGIPTIDKPRFVTPAKAKEWIKPNEPVISLVIAGKARAYPLQILIWHEIVNDRVGGVPITVTFCPLCYSAIVFDRRVIGREHTFGVSGMLRNSDLVMYDRQTETLWQQMTGEAIVGDLTGTTLTQLPAQIISFQQFVDAHKDGRVLSRKTGHRRAYGRNPYTGYDDITKKPFLYRGKRDKRLPPMEKVVAVGAGKQYKAYPHSLTRKLRVIEDSLGSQPIVIFHGDGAVSGLDRPRISSSREIGSTGVFDPRIDGRKLTFKYAEGKFVDNETASVWDITGRAISGKLKGRQLRPIVHGDYFAFAWLVFRPETKVYRRKPAPPSPDANNLGR